MTRSRSSIAVGMGLWTIVVLIALRGVADAKSELQLIKYKMPQLYPESFDWDRKHDRFIVGSTVLGKLVTLTDTGAVEDFVSDSDLEGKSEVHGVFVDARRNRVLAVVEAGRGEFDPQVARLVAYDLDSKKRTLMVTLSEEGTQPYFFKDVCADNEGNAYVTETTSNSVWKVTSSGEASLFVTLPQYEILQSEPMFAQAGVSGLVFVDGLLLLSQFNSGALIRVKVSDRKVEKVKVADGLTMSEADGMAIRQDGALVVVSSHTAWLLSSRDFWHSATLVDKVVLEKTTYSTSVAVKDLRVYVLASYLHEDLEGLSREDFQIEEIEFPADVANNPLYLLVIVGMFGLLVLIWKFQVNQFNKSYTKKRM